MLNEVHSYRKFLYQQKDFFSSADILVTMNFVCIAANTPLGKRGMNPSVCVRVVTNQSINIQPYRFLLSHFCVFVRVGNKTPTLIG